MLFGSQSDVNDHILGNNLADFNLIIVNLEGVVSSNLHFGYIADIVIGLSHKELEIEAGEGIEEVEFGAIKVGVAFEFDLEGDVLVAWGDLEDSVALAHSVVNNI